MRLELTQADIAADIEQFRVRIDTARSKLDQLPTRYLPYQEYKRREKQKHDLQAEIEHVQKLICIAKEGIEACEC